MSEIKYVPPGEMKELHEQLSVHKLELTIDGKEIGYAELKYRNNPFPFYYFQDLNINNEYQGKGYGSKLLSQVNEFIEERGKTAFLYESIDQDSPAFGMYERNGWNKVVGAEDGWYVRNRREGISDELLKKAVEVIKYREWEKPGYSELLFDD